MEKKFISTVHQTRAIPFGQYTFYANVYDPINHHTQFDRWPLQFLPKVYHIVIQTDKDLYKPEDLIRFRLFAFDADTRPVNVEGPSVISIVDPQGFTMQNITNFTFTRGRYSNEMELSSFVTNGQWTIKVFADNRVNLWSICKPNFLTKRLTGFRESHRC